MSKRVEKPILSVRALALAGALLAGTGLVACQSAPVTSKEPAPKEPAAAATAQNPEPQGAAPTHQAAVKLTGGSPPSASAAAAPAPADELASEGAPKKGAAKGGAPDKTAETSAPAGKTVQGNVVSEEPFSTWLQVTSPVKAGGPLQLEAVLVAKAPYHCNEEYPHKFKLGAAPAGLSYPEETVRGMKVTPERSVLSIPVTAQSAGKPTVAGTLSFSVCTEERCLVEKRELSVALDVM